MGRRETSQNGPLVFLCARCRILLPCFAVLKQHGGQHHQHHQHQRGSGADSTCSRSGPHPPSFTVASFPGGPVAFRFFWVRWAEG